jgi:hypothetical protein
VYIYVRVISLEGKENIGLTLDFPK